MSIVYFLIIYRALGTSLWTTLGNNFSGWSYSPCDPRWATTQPPTTLMHPRTANVRESPNGRSIFSIHTILTCRRLIFRSSHHPRSFVRCLSIKSCASENKYKTRVQSWSLSSWPPSVVVTAPSFVRKSLTRIWRLYFSRGCRNFDFLLSLLQLGKRKLSCVSSALLVISQGEPICFTSSFESNCGCKLLMSRGWYNYVCCLATRKILVNF